jgi:hypothetical protein
MDLGRYVITGTFDRVSTLSAALCWIEHASNIMPYASKGQKKIGRCPEGDGAAQSSRLCAKDGRQRRNWYIGSN